MRDRIAELISKYEGSISDVALLIAEGNDRDEYEDKLTREIAENEGIVIPDDNWDMCDEFCDLNSAISDAITKELGE